MKFAIVLKLVLFLVAYALMRVAASLGRWTLGVLLIFAVLWSAVRGCGCP